MSHRLYFACIDHDPPFVASTPFDQHGDYEAMQAALGYREELLEQLEIVSNRFEPYPPELRGVAFFVGHPKCRLACQDEYLEWTDLGQGLPDSHKIGVTENG